MDKCSIVLSIVCCLLSVALLWTVIPHRGPGEHVPLDLLVHDKITRALLLASGAWWEDGPIYMKPLRSREGEGLTAARQVGEVTMADFETSDGIAMRLFRPLYMPRHRTPMVLWYPGGGWTLGSPRSLNTEKIGLEFARSGVVFLASDYRKAPENKFPAAVEDAERVARWLLTQAALPLEMRATGPFAGIDMDRITIGGDSAGANLAAVVAARLRDTGFRVTSADSGGVRPVNFSRQVLAYPAFFQRPTESETRLGNDALLLPLFALRFFERCYIEGTDCEASPAQCAMLNPAASPNGLRGLPETTVLVAKHDILSDNGRWYHTELQKAGVKSVLKEYNSYHGFLDIDNYEEQHHVIAQLVEAIKAD